jgi:hypothetical protein
VDLRWTGGAEAWNNCEVRFIASSGKALIAK